MKKCISMIPSRLLIVFIATVGLLLTITGFLYSSFALQEPISSVSFLSEKLNYNEKAPGSFKVEKSAKWISQDRARVTFDVDTILKTENKDTDIIFVLDISGSMSGEKLERVKQDSIELVNALLSNPNNKAALITFDTGSKILSDFTNDKEVLVNLINNLSDQGVTNYYQALVNTDSILRHYKKDENKDCIVLFLTDGYPNEDVPNEETQYQYLKKEYPYLVINGIQYEMGNEILEPIKKVSDHQYLANMDTLNNVLFDASVIPIPYDSFVLTDYIDTDNFYVESSNDIKVSQGKVEFNKEEQKITWIVDYLRTGSKPRMTIDMKQKEELIGTGGIYPTNKKEEVGYQIGEIEEDITSTKTPILKDNYQVIYEGNGPNGCTVSNVPSTKSYTIFDKVAVDSSIPTCEGYQFTGWRIVDNDVKRINSDYFEMPEKNVILRAEWKSLSLSKSMNGEVYVYIPPVIQKIGTYNYNKEIWKYKDSITKVVFQNEIRSIKEATETFDISEEKNGGVMGYIVPNPEDTSTYTAYIQGDGKIIANQDSSYLFYNFTKLTTIEGIEYLDTSKVINMSCMFNTCTDLTSLDVGHFDTSKVTEMDYMFKNCSSLTSLDLSNFNTSNVTNMDSIFYNCSSLTSLDVSNFDTSNVTNMYSMFSDCSSLTSLDLSNFDTSNVTNMGSMFSYCSSLISLDVSHFNTSKTTGMTYMFYKCRNLVNLDVSHFDTSKVTRMEFMFANCNSLTSLDVSNFNTSKVEIMSNMFTGCSSLTSLDLSKFDTSKVIMMRNMFGLCSSLESLDVSNFDTSKVVDMHSMFSYCSSLTSLDVSHFGISKDMGYMFFGCSSLTTTINIYDSSVTDYSDMFNGSATDGTSQITVNYIESTSDLVDRMIATKSADSNVVKGRQIFKYNITIEPPKISSNLSNVFAGTEITLTETTNNYQIKSFYMNEVLVEGNSFIMPESDVVITKVCYEVIIESEHNPYPGSLNNKVYGEHTFDGATSLTVTLEYQTQSTLFDYIYLYDSTNKQYGKYGGTTRKTETITIPGNYIKITLKTNMTLNNYYGFKANIIPNYN